MIIAGVDIGGINVKIAKIELEDGNINNIYCFSESFYTKKMLRKVLLENLKECDIIVITQTLCASRKFFRTYKEGTIFLMKTFLKLFPLIEIKYLTHPFKLVSSIDVEENYKIASCKNWLGTVYLFVKYLRLIKNGLIIDCGTNSTDILSIIDSEPICLANNDKTFSRLSTGELLWSGLLYTPITIFTDEIELDGVMYSITANNKALSGDIYITLKRINLDDLIPYKKEEKDLVYFPWPINYNYHVAVDRILSTFGADRVECSIKDAERVAIYLMMKQQKQILSSIEKVRREIALISKVNLKNIVLTGIGKNILLKPIVCKISSQIKEVSHIKIINKKMGKSTFININNCETALGCALAGFHNIDPQLPEIFSDNDHITINYK